MLDAPAVIEAHIGEAVYYLKPTLKAMREINTRYGNLVDAVVALRKSDFDAVVLVIAAGAGLLPKARELLAEEIFRHGVVRAAGPAADFMATLMDPSGQGAADEEPDSGNV